VAVRSKDTSMKLVPLSSPHLDLVFSVDVGLMKSLSVNLLPVNLSQWCRKCWPFVDDKELKDLEIHSKTIKKGLEINCTQYINLLLRTKITDTFLMMNFQHSTTNKQDNPCDMNAKQTSKLETISNNQLTVKKLHQA